MDFNCFSDAKQDKNPKPAQMPVFLYLISTLTTFWQRGENKATKLSSSASVGRHPKNNYLIGVEVSE